MTLFGGPFVPHASAAPQTQQSVTRDTYGEVGLLDMPSAHMAPDGAFGVSMGDVGNYQRYSFFFQRWPWLETSFRYSRVPYWGGSRVYYDRSFGAKIRLFNEQDSIADVSVGIRDLLGTGVYGAEYLVASRHIGPFDLTAGMGWGRLSGTDVLSNPVGAAIASFKKRTPPSGSGLVDFGEFFHGPKVGLFGGAAWQTPVDGLKILAEYSSDKYSGERAYRGGLRVRSPVNVGLSYSPVPSVAVSAGWYYGTTYGFTVSLTGDPTTTYPSAIRVGPAIPTPAIRTAAQQEGALTVMSAHSAIIMTGPHREVGALTPPERSRQRLLEAFYSETRGVRSVDVVGKALAVDANFTGNGSEQCARYARIASATGIHTTTIAMTDLQNPDGDVIFCPIRRTGADDRTFAAGTLDESGRAELHRKLAADFAVQDLQFDAMSVGNSEMWVYFENHRYRTTDEAVGRVVRLLMKDAPPDIEIFHIILTQFGIPMHEIVITRSGLERAFVNDAGVSGLGQTIALNPAPMSNPALDQSAPDLYPSFAWSLDPKVSQHLFDPDRPMQFLVYADATGLLQLAPGLMLSTELTGQIWTNLSYTRPPSSVLPHVRTDLLEYLKHGKYGITSLMLTYRTRLAPDVFAEARAGYLEDMFMGAGGQVLWRPEGSRLAFGADLYQVWKRGFHRLFDPWRDPVTGRGYNVLTGHISVYYDSPWHGVNYALHVGRYLAGDYGATLEVSRRFSSGVEIGAWATFTNVPFNKFGEGSFDKGLIIHIPFEWGLPVWSQSSYDMHLASLTRDGGQRLAGDDSLYDATRRSSYGDITEHLNEIVDP